MHTPLAHRILSLGLIAALIVILSVALANPVRAALGTSGVPVRCTKIGAPSSIPEGSQFVYLNCYAADGTAFTDGQRVPKGHYLLITDVVITPDGGTDSAAVTDVSLYDSYSTNLRAFGMRFRGTTTATYGEHYTTPYMVLPADHRLEVVTAGWAEKWVEVRVSGLLVTNVNYLPLVAGE